MTDSERIEERLGFHKIRAYVEALCSSDAAKRMVQDATFSTDAALVGKMLAQTDEMRVISMLESGFPDTGYVDTYSFLVHLEHSNYYLDVLSVAKLRTALNTMRQISLFFGKTKDDAYPEMKELIKPVIFFPEVTRRIDGLLDRFGEIKDNASEELSKIRKSIKEKESTISRRVHALLKQGQKDGFIDKESSVSVREGRMLLPVTASNKRKVPGFVVDESSSGKTLYIEPMEIVELNNQVTELHFAEQREVLKILVDFSDFLRPYREELLHSSRILSNIDFIWAKARFAVQTSSGKPVISRDKDYFLKDARNPLLQRVLEKEGKKIVPLTFRLNKEKHILLISGPNAGGKSVCLKTAGLLQYMMQCGFLISASESSELPLFDRIFIDIGDEQSIENDLSTYSSHLSNMRMVLKESTPDSLILIDEFGSGTEPTAGGAIAEAILEEIEKRGSFGIITTHYANLKLFASASKGVVNGGMLFDVKNIQPLFKLETGTPGSSFAFELARKMGLSEPVVKNAEIKAGTEFVDMERHLRKIARNRRAWEERLAKIKSTDKTLENITDKYQKELSDIEKMRKQILREAKEEASAMLSEANKQIEATIKEIREKQAEKESTKIVRKQLSDFENKVKESDTAQDDDLIARKMEQLIRRKERREQKKRERAKRSGELTVEDRKREPSNAKKNIVPVVGSKVKIKGSDLIGEVIAVEGKTLNVAVGSVLTKVNISKAETISSNEFAATAGMNASHKPFSVTESEDVSRRRLEFRTTLDIRGQRLEEAINSVTGFIDDALMTGTSPVRILHGKGNGILREEIRKYLKSMWNIRSMRDEELQMGGSGITVIDLD
jgi:DNA mismatch repair protein MutS2